MTSSEKRYFKKDAKDSNTLDLFDIINEQSHYNEEDVKNKLNDSSFASNLKVHKNRLQQILLKNLRSFYEEKTAQSKIKVLIENSEIFLKKQLYDIAYAQLDKAIQFCKNYEEYELMLVALGIKARMSTYFSELNSSEDSPIVEMGRCAHLIQNYIQHATINKKILRLVDESAGDAISDLYTKIKDIIDKEVISKKEEPVSPIAERMYLYSQALMHNAKGDLQKACELTKQIVTHFEENAFIVEEKNAQYFNTIINYLTFCCRLDNAQKEVETYVNKALKHASVYEHLMPNMLYAYNAYIESLRQGGHFLKIKAILETDIKALIQKFELQKNFIAKRIMAISIESYLAYNEYDVAGTLLRDLLNTKQNLPKDMLHALYVLELVYHFDQGDFVFIENLVNAHQKRVRRNNEQLQFFDMLLSFFKKLGNTNLSEQKNIFQLHKSALPKFEDDVIYSQLNFFYNYECWVDMHIRRVPYRIIMEEKKRNDFDTRA